MDRDRRALSGPAVVTVAVPVAFLAVFFLWPLLAILERSFFADGSLDLPLDVLARRSTLETTWFTLWLAAVSTVLTLVAALPLAWALGRFSFRGRWGCGAREVGGVRPGGSDRVLTRRGGNMCDVFARLVVRC